MNFPSVSSSSVISIARVSATGVVIELGRDVCRFWYTVFRLSSVRTTCADFLALWCVNASFMHASRRSSRTECGLQWCPESLHDAKCVKSPSSLLHVFPLLAGFRD